MDVFGTIAVEYPVEVVMRHTVAFHGGCANLIVLGSLTRCAVTSVHVMVRVITTAGMDVSVVLLLL